MFRRRFKRCYCMNNSAYNTNSNVLEDKCDDVCPCEYEECEKDECEFGFDEEYEMGVFPELVSPYMPCQSMRVNEFLEATNKVGEGCNADGRR